MSNMLFDEYLKGILVPLLREPEKVVITTSQDQMGTLLSVRVGVGDMGTVIGKEGENAKAIRTLVRIFGAHNQARLAVRFLEPDGKRFRSES